MTFLGIDFGWQSQPSGCVAIKRSRVVSFERPETPEDVLEWVDSFDGDAMAAVDAPLVIPNATGMREADKQMHRVFGRQHAGCYPANLGRPFAARTTAFARALEDRGFRHAASIEPRARGRFQIEVHPHAATVRLFKLDRIIKYKRGPLDARRRELSRYRSLLLGLLPGVSLPAVPSNGRDLKDLEDRLDGLLCAHIGEWWWKHGSRRSDVYGTAADGYIVVPRP